eukprot:gnl/MRDRNA2_/MRDRNA2_14375_c0_seq1.p3 gnl/MRDRNA2_/MRDRNA2_14375_c0~~gnl/MRDRNA2_/MRDRNA2_14375_c0_seq1.p3  ORF type:complete len:113 (+),score=25.30 gnl/MRDRNA2_/MRDRNA2_14375_c0_seq1:705-1043(+)
MKSLPAIGTSQRQFDAAINVQHKVDVAVSRIKMLSAGPPRADEAYTTPEGNCFVYDPSRKIEQLLETLQGEAERRLDVWLKALGSGRAYKHGVMGLALHMETKLLEGVIKHG